MHKQNSKKIIKGSAKLTQRLAIFFLVITVIFNSLTFSAPKAQAFFAIVHDPINWAIHGLQLAAAYIGNLSLGIPGSGAGITGAIKAAKTPCKVAKHAYEIANTVDAFPAADIIAGSSGQIAKLQSKVSALTIVRNCYQLVLDSDETAAAALALASGIQGLTTMAGNDALLESAIENMDLRLDDLKKLRSEAVKELWKSVAIRILYDVQKKITTDLVNKMVAKYKIGDLQAFAGSVAAQVYTVDYMSNNVKSGQDQALLRSIMQNQFTQGAVSPLAKIKAQQSLGFDPSKVSPTSSTYYTQLAQAGAPESQPWFQQLEATGAAQQIQTSSLALAKQEISNGGGIMAVRSCKDVSAQQSKFDQQHTQLLAAADLNDRVLQKLQADPSTKPADLQKATTALAASQSQLTSLPQGGQVFAKACGDILNPGKAVGDFTNSFLQSNLISSNAPNNSNLPFFAGFAEKVASNFLTNTIEGGNSNFQNFNGSGKGLQSGNVPPSQVVGTSPNPQLQALKTADTASSQSAVVFSVSPSSVSGQYTANWDASLIDGASSVSIAAPASFSASSTSFTASSTQGSTIIRLTPPVTVTLTVYDVSHSALTSASFAVAADLKSVLQPPTSSSSIGSLTQQENQQLLNDGTIQPPPPLPLPPAGLTDTQWQNCLNQNLTAAQCNQQIRGLVIPAVQGAFISRVPLQIRGPALESIHPRGY